MTDAEFLSAVSAAREDLLRTVSPESAVPSIVDVLAQLNRDGVIADRATVIARAEKLDVVLCDLPVPPMHRVRR